MWWISKNLFIGFNGLNQFQAKEATDIPKEVYDKVIAELKKLRITNQNSLSIPRMKEILKRLDLSDYYEHIVHIITKITGKHPPILSRETEEEIKQMFKDIQAPFEKYCPVNRTNFLNYSYVLHKTIGKDFLINLINYFKKNE